MHSGWRESQRITGVLGLAKSSCRCAVSSRSEDLNVCTEVMPGVHEVLRHLTQRGARLGVATGNLQRIGELKLRRAGLLDYFQFGAWSDAFEYRADVIRAGVAQVSKTAALCVVGDTPADVAAAHQNHLPVIAVATGIYSFDDLERAQPEICLHSFAELLSFAL